MIAVLGSLSGCLVTDPIEFDRPANNPPAFVMERPPKLQLGEIKYLSARDVPSGWKFTLRVRDQDVDQELEAQWRIVTGGTARKRKSTIIIPATGAQVRELTIPVDQGELDTDSCHRVEIAVSGSFVKPFEGDMEDLTRFADVDVDDRFDIAMFTFWIWEGEPNANDPAKLVETCGAQLFIAPTVAGAGGTADTAGEGG